MHNDVWDSSAQPMSYTSSMTWFVWMKYKLLMYWYLIFYNDLKLNINISLTRLGKLQEPLMTVDIDYETFFFSGMLSVRCTDKQSLNGLVGCEWRHGKHSTWLNQVNSNPTQTTEGLIRRKVVMYYNVFAYRAKSEPLP